jgi:hypothetical protein
MSTNGRSIYKTLNRTMYAEREHLKIVKTCIVFVIQPVYTTKLIKLIKDKQQSSPIMFKKNLKIRAQNSGQKNVQLMAPCGTNRNFLK